MNTKLTIRPYARLLTMLGDQLIKNEQIAVLELIKNAYDADADWVKLSFVGFSPSGAALKDSKIVIEDNGVGMSKDIIQNAWMSPATANKSSKDGEVKLTKTKKRIIQGEKGIGRYAMLKLGSIINMITRPEECAEEYSVRLDFSSFDENYSSIGLDSRNLYLDELSFDLQTSSPKEFVNRSVSIGRKIFEGPMNAHGTRLEIRGLKGRWNQAKIDAVKASFVQFGDFFDEVITKEKQPDFFIGVSVNGENIDEEDASDNIVMENLMETQSVFQIKSGHYDSKEKTLSFEINGSIKNLSCASDEFRGLRVFKDNFFDRENKTYRDISDFGDFDFNFYIFDFNAKTPSRYALVEGAKDILKKHRVYLLRDNVRVMPYGDPSDDWLQIDIGRGTISAGAFFSNDQLVGQIRITKKGNPHLKDKTNREGLIEEESYTDDFICIIRSFLSYLRITAYKRYLDENKRKNEIEKTNTRQVNKELSNLKKYFKDDKKASSLLSQLEKVYKVEREYLECRANRTESLAAVGLSVETASHDMMLMMEKGLSQLQGLMKDCMLGTIDTGSLTSEMQKLLGIFTFVKEHMKDMQLLFTSSKQRRRQLRVEDYLKKVQTIYKRTLQRCSITCETEIIGSPLLAKCTDADILQLLINLMDNAVYWLEAGGIDDRRIKIVLDGNKCQMIFSDNGPGIRQEDVPYIFEAFYSGKGEEGRGLGLYISRKLMERNEYSIDLADLDSEKVLKGANFVVSFIKQKNDMENENLFKGIGMVVDDHVYRGNDVINGIVKYLENDNHLPLVKYEALPDKIESICFSNLSFLLLDWELNTLVDDDGLPIQDATLKAQNARENVDFIKQVVDKVVIPIFIFSNEDVNSIKNTLSEYNIIDDDEKSPIFILSKSELFDNDKKCIMFDKVNEWLKKTPSIYVTQKWKTAYLDAINVMALDMREASPFWPNLLWACYKSDGVNPSEEISSLINQNALSRIQPVEFDDEILSNIEDDNNCALKNVLERQCFLKKDKLQLLSTTGDIYQRDKGKYYLNVRPACDCVGRKGECKVYLIKGKKLSSHDLQTFFDTKYGNFKEQQNFVIVGPIESAFIRFNFQEMEIKDYEEIKDQRIGRLLPPFITRVTPKYGLYIHRQGLPRLPKEVIPAVAPIEDDNEDEFGEEIIDALQEEIKDSKSKVQLLSKENKELKSKMKRITNSQNCYRLYNCKVTISPSLKRRKGKR